jgi:uncharacterized membrane protein YbhN (UPF0104 family)
MTPAGLIVVFSILVSLGALVLFSLALANVFAGWGIFLLYTVPALATLAWAWRETSPATWRLAIWPLVRVRRRATLFRRRREPREAAGSAAQPAGRPSQPAAVAHAVAVSPPEPAAVVVEGAIKPWLVFMRAFLAAWRSPRGRVAFAVGFGVAATGTLVLVVTHFASIGWPLRHADLARVAVAGSLFLCAYPLKALGWRRLFRSHERPRGLTLAAAGGAASVTGVALPGRFDDVVRVAVVRGLTGPHPRVGTVVLTLFLLGLVDAAALVPYATIAAVSTNAALWVRILLGVVAAAGVGAGILVATLPRIAASQRLGHYRLGRWLNHHAPDSTRNAWQAFAFVTTSWLVRAAGLAVLLEAFGLDNGFPLAIAYLSAAAAATALPIGPAGAATQAGAGAIVLTAAGIDTNSAAAFAIVAQSLFILSGAAIVIVTLLLRVRGRLRFGRSRIAPR